MTRTPIQRDWAEGAQGLINEADSKRKATAPIKFGGRWSPMLVAWRDKGDCILCGRPILDGDEYRLSTKDGRRCSGHECCVWKDIPKAKKAIPLERVETVKLATTKTSGHTCPVHFTELPLSGICTDCAD